MTNDLVDLQSRLSPYGTPLLGDCKLITGDGTQAVEFKGGRAQAPRELAEALVRGRGDVMIVQHVEVDPGPAPPAPVGDGDAASRRAAAGLRPDANPDVLAEVEGERRAARADTEKRADIEAAQAHLAADGETVPDPEPETFTEEVEVEGDGVEKQGVELPADGTTREVRFGPSGNTTNAKVKVEGDLANATTNAAEQPPPLPEGFEARTPEGDRRCLAKKGDGGQCKNAAHDGWACKLAAHRKQLEG